MRDWFFGLAVREQWMVAIGALLAVVIVFWGGVWNPLFSGTAELGERVSNDERTLANVYRAEALRKPNNSGSRGGGRRGSLVVIVDQTTRNTGLAEAVKRTQPDGPDGIRVTLQGASFDSVVRWLSLLDSSQGVTVETASVDETRQPGIVNCTLVLRSS